MNQEIQNNPHKMAISSQEQRKPITNLASTPMFAIHGCENNHLAAFDHIKIILLRNYKRCSKRQRYTFQQEKMAC